ncbi:hypothetical protein [Rugamonas violacea]|nr:hypothetical protein [Rugamonas sp. CCM 8940]
MQTSTIPVAIAHTDAHRADHLLSGVSWGAILAGAAAAAALSLILLMLGVGLGLSAVSPWAPAPGAAVIGGATIAWLAFTQLAASGLGGYLAGRLRIKWASVHTDEVYFRDTAHGLLAWAIATLLTATLLVGSVRATLSGAIDSAAPVVAPVAGAVAAGARGGNSANPVDYFSDMLLRSDKPDANSAEARAEVVRIVGTGLGNGGLTPDDRNYLARVVAARSGMAQADAEKRVDDVYARANSAIEKAKIAAKDAADTARKAAAWSAIWMAVSLLLGAFVASMLATFGGRLRDRVESHSTATVH